MIDRRANKLMEKYRTSPADRSALESACPSCLQ
jgi:hypothetical protein